MATAAEIAIITAPDLRVAWGVELLDADGAYVEDISVDVVEGQVKHQSFERIHGTCRFKLRRALDWSNVLLRPYQTLTGAGNTQRWNLGVFRPTTPRTAWGTKPAAHDVTGMDLLSLLAGDVGDTYVVASGVAYLTAVAAAITAAGVTGATTYFDSAKAASTVPAPGLEWVLDEREKTTWLDVPNDLLVALAYDELWADADGRFRSDLWVDPSDRGPAWEFDLSDQSADIVLPKRSQTIESGYDTSAGVNWWRFIQAGITTLPAEVVDPHGTPVGTQYTVDNSGAGTKHKATPQTLHVTNAEALVAEGDKIVQQDTQSATSIVLETHPLPVFSHLDVVGLNDPEGAGSARCQVRSYTHTLGKRPRTRLELEVL